METSQHSQLKHRTVAYLMAQGCCAAAVEVSCPISRYRVDVAGYIDRVRPQARETASPPDQPLIEWESVEQAPARRSRTVIVECKQARADFLRDSRRLDRLLEQRRQLDAARTALEERIIRVAEPHLRQEGTSLFRELEDWDFTASRMGSYRRIARELRALDQQIHGQTKFWLAARYRLADMLYIAAPLGLIHPRELPPGWGLLEAACTPDCGEDGSAQDAGEWLVIKVRCGGEAARPDRRARLLRNIAVAATNRLMRNAMVERRENGVGARPPSADLPSASIRPSRRPASGRTR